MGRFLLIAEMARRAFDCVLLDHRLGDTTGSALLRSIRELTTYVGPIIMVTGAGSESLVVEAMQEGATDYLPKVQQHHDAMRDRKWAMEARH